MQQIVPRRTRKARFRRIFPWLLLVCTIWVIHSVYLPYYYEDTPEFNVPRPSSAWLAGAISKYAIPETTDIPNSELISKNMAGSMQKTYGSFQKRIIKLEHCENAWNSLVKKNLNPHLMEQLSSLKDKLNQPHLEVKILYTDYVRNNKINPVNSRVLAVQTDKWTYYGKRTSAGFLFFDKNGNSHDTLMDRSPFAYERISSNFDPYRVHPITRRVRPHRGVDLKGPYGTKINVTADGEVSFAGWQKGYGKIVIVSHRGGYETRYAHLSGIDVSTGQVVRRGQVIGRLGSSGASTGAHLHYEVRVNGVAYNPMTIKLPTSYHLRPQDMQAWKEEIFEYTQDIAKSNEDVESNLKQATLIKSKNNKLTN